MAIPYIDNTSINQPDPGMLMGGIRNHQVEINGISSEFIRNADQGQDVFQTSRAFYGAVNNNNLTQSEYVDQSGISSNTKEVEITPPAPNNNISPNFHHNYLQRVITDVDALNYLARGLGNSNQDQLAGQSAVAGLMDFDGNQSVSTNNLFQDEAVDQKLELTEVQTHVKVHQPEWVWNNARFREIQLDVNDHSAEAILAATQRQGYTVADPELKGNSLYDSPVTQFGAADGAIAQNNLSQSAQVKQTNTVFMENTYDLRRMPESPLSPRTTDIFISLNSGEQGVNRAVNSEDATQRQALVQQALGSVDETGQITENGGFVQNTAMQIAEIREQAQVEHITTVIA